ncbi:MAG: ATP-dependent Clp protease adapter ClpS [Lentisphaeria bacterium]|jgi:ATP-dependent Clp protease adaptor protein ClpS|nr:ATP-dependent Clp protease adapter ClpS [Lentisphaeria bacterium]MDP7742210.1 ATP-dependent Clp protease adapter ClpS [Lentisphaeria bacterium]
MPGNTSRPRQDEDVLIVEKTTAQKPRMFKVVLHNDDYTPMEFVIMVLEAVFNKTQEDAVHIMLSVHNQGIGVCGIYTADIAETKVAKVGDLAAVHEYPLKCTMEPE